MAKTSTVPKYFIQSIPDGGVTTKKLATSCITTQKLGDNQVTPQKARLDQPWDFRSGNVYVPTPSGLDDATSKRYVDDKLVSVSSPTQSQSFAFNTATVQFSVPANAIIDKVSVRITTPFNNTGASSITVAVLNTSTVILAIDQLGMDAQHNFVYLGGYLNGSSTDTLQLTVSAGNASAGQGLITVTMASS